MSTFFTHDNNGNARTDDAKRDLILASIQRFEAGKGSSRLTAGFNAAASPSLEEIALSLSSTVDVMLPHIEYLMQDWISPGVTQVLPHAAASHRRYAYRA